MWSLSNVEIKCTSEWDGRGSEGPDSCPPLSPRELRYNLCSSWSERQILLEITLPGDTAAGPHSHSGAVEGPSPVKVCWP